MSLQLDRYLEERAAGGSIDDACFASGIDRGEAELHEKDIESGALELPLSRARAREDINQPEEPAMAREDLGSVTMKIGDGPELPINLDNIDDPANAEAKGAIAEHFGKSGGVAADELRLFIERVERLNEEIKGINDDKKDVFGEAKARGFDTSAMKQCIKLRKMEPHKLQEAEAILHIYMTALGLDHYEPSAALGVAA